MKEKILNYFVIIGVSIILLLGIVTTAFGQDNSRSVDDYTINFVDDNEKCEGANTVPIHHKKLKNNDWPRIGCIKTGLDVKIIGIKDNLSSIIQIQGNYKPEYLMIENDFLYCRDRSIKKCETTSSRKSSP
ncbi:hypothetical protein BJP34_13785 [Moorena producens PAL-8-15-08-1]|uniref:Uncharacterized protein n=1 Tax=Moorena producens PAL-8-15-08-1 TaxID=1458985 RepID=A0A1D8TRV8_9CYAN|nr:hypothetical protein [Moorena producens]AOX00380.1 hypothetical protein BJP34_13785 [Moorena producens PAL-8-15-08-1]